MREGEEACGDHGRIGGADRLRRVPRSGGSHVERSELRLREPWLGGLRVCGAPVGAGRERRARDDHRAPPAERLRGPRGRVDRRRWARRRAERRDDVAPDRRRCAPGHAVDGLCRDHAPRRRPLLRPAPRERRRRREPPARGARDERPTAALGASGSTDAPSRIRSSCPDRIAAGSRSRRRSRGTAVSRRATASASGSSGSAWPGRSAARGSRSCPGTRSATADTRCGNSARPRAATARCRPVRSRRTRSTPLGLTPQAVGVRREVGTSRSLRYARTILTGVPSRT